MVPRSIVKQATASMGALGEEMIPVTSHEAGGCAGWHTLMMPATEGPCEELSDDLLQAERVTRVTDARGDNFVAWFPKRLKGYLAGTIVGRDEPVRDGARSIWYNVHKYGSRRAEQLAKRHLKRPETRRAMWARLI